MVLLDSIDKIRDFSSLDPQQMSEQEILNWMATLIDSSFDLRSTLGSERVIHLVDTLSTRNWSNFERAMFFYYIGNAWSDYNQIKGETGFWNENLNETPLSYFRMAYNAIKEIKEDSTDLRMRIMTNLANKLSTLGRSIEAIDLYDKVLKIHPDFAMAYCSKATALDAYSHTLYDSGHFFILKQVARENYLMALRRSKYLEKDISSYIEKQLERIPPSDDLGALQDVFSLGGPEEEKYRIWCLKNKLFLNPLNEITDKSIAARDIFHLPDMTVALDDRSYYYGLFNQIKQEFASARYTFYQGITEKNLHFSDKNNLLIDTLDYPVYSLAIERVKMAHRLLYSILSRISIFVHFYFLNSLGVSENLTFVNVWFKNNKKNNGIRDEIYHSDNWPLRGLYYISRDFEKKGKLKEVLDEKSKKMDYLRHQAEHQYLKVVQVLAEPSGDRLDNLPTTWVQEDELQSVVLELMKLVRAAIIHLSLAVNVKEKAAEKSGNVVHLEQPILPRE